MVEDRNESEADRLHDFRVLLVGGRREAIQDVLSRCERANVEEVVEKEGARVKAIQDLIAAVDEAIKDEERIAEEKLEEERREKGVKPDPIPEPEDYPDS